MNARILVVEDERAIQLALGGLLRKLGHDVVSAESGAAALRMLTMLTTPTAEAFDMVITDLSLGDGPSGMDVLRAAKEAHPEVPVLMITAHGSERVAVEAMKLGAEDYVPKPFDNDEIRLIVGRALDRTRLLREHRLLLERVARQSGLDGMIGSGSSMQRLFGAIVKVAETDLGVLVRGESGSGKELIAQAIHQRSPRARRPFVAVNCAAFSRELVESELFGHEKGAFTGASARRIGRFEAAEGGTIFLDEIGDMPLETQAKVLRVLQERTLDRVGGTRPIQVDVRVIAATHRDLEADVSSGKFQQDLLFRLDVVRLVAPPLRERLEDLPALVEHFLGGLSQRLGRAAPRPGPSAMQRLARHPWPGNVRELRNVLEQAAVLAAGASIEPGELRLAPLPHVGLGTTESSSDLGGFSEAKRQAVEAWERAFLTAALERHAGNVSQTAEAIGMVRQSLQQKLRDLGLRAESFREK